MLDGGTVSVLRASCDSTEGRKSIRKGAVASLEILLHAICYLSPQTYLSIPVTGAATIPPQNNEPTQGV